MINQTISHYKILEKLGEGGMGVVYKAHDQNLDRLVALKFLSTRTMANEVEKARFVQEAKAAAALNHPNICTIYEINEFEGQSFIVMEYIEGQTLREKIASGQLDVTAAIEIAIQIVEGINKAHEKNIIHRDIKSANIMMNDEGQVKIMDFGLAKSMGQVGLTTTRATVGTVAYMSPEQARGEVVDHRTDIWSFGVVLYEMLTGELPFQGDYEQAVIYSILNAEPNAPSQLRSGIARNIEILVFKTLQKNREDRYTNLQEILADLKAPSSNISAKEEGEKSIIVLPFVNMSPDPEQEYFSDGLTEEIITDLSHIHDLLVISRSSAMTFKGTKKKLKEIAREVNVQYVLEGSVRKAGNNIKITAQLIDATNDAHLWAEKYGGTLDDVFDIQETVSRSIVGALKLKLSPEEMNKIAEHPITNVQAYEYYLRASAEIFKFTKDSIHRAIQYLQQGLVIMGDNPLLLSSMALAYFNLVNIGVEHEDCHAKAEEYANRALLIDKDFPQAHAVYGWMCCVDGGLVKSIYHLKRALAVNPDDSLAMVILVMVYADFFGKISAAVPLCEKLARIAPLEFPTNAVSSHLYFYDGQFDRALREWKKLYEMFPENAYSRFWYALILTYHNENDKAFSIIDNAAGDNPDNVLAKLGLMLKYACQNNKEKAFQVMTPDFRKACKRDATYSHHIAGFCSLLNEREEALYWLESAVNRSFFNYPLLSKDPYLENIRGEERFKKLMERVKHEWENFEV